MPPSKAGRTAANDDTNLDPIATTKAKLVAQVLAGGRGKRNGLLHAINGSSLKEVMSTTGSLPHTNANGSAAALQNGIQWSAESSDFLERYRYAYRLSAPSSFKNPMAQCMLSSGIGKNSPTMARTKAKRRISKEQLALVVRKNFNALPVNENEAIVELLYRIRMKNKAFRIKFPAVKSK